jgi:nicotinate-nucleotide adenylyltransferase
LQAFFARQPDGLAASRFESARPRPTMPSMTKPRRIGILGGSFDPIHVGHLSIAQQVGDKLRLDEVVLVPAGEPPHKEAASLAPPEDRLAMARLAIRGLARLSVSDTELRRPGPSYTLDTVRDLKARLGPDNEYFFIVGADNDLLGEISFVAAARPGHRPDFETVRQRLGDEAVLQLKRVAVDIEPCDVSSTEIRRRVATGEDITPLVRAPVAEYIARNGLYR